LKDTQIVRLTQYPGEDGGTQVLSVRALLDRTLAQHLSCHDNCFAENSMPRHFVDLKLTGLVIQNCEVDLDGSVLLADKVSNFAVGRPKKAASDTDPSLEVCCNLHFGYVPSLSDWAHRKNKAQFQTMVQPPADWNAQQSLFEQSDTEAQAEEDDGVETREGEDIASQAAAEVTEMVDAASAEIPPEAAQEPVSDHLTGEALERHNALSGVATAGPMLVSAREMGGTHQAKARRGARGSGKVAAPEPEEPAASA